MQVKDLIKELQKCDPEDRIKLIQGEQLECEPDWWDKEKGDYGEVSGLATELYHEDLFSHDTYLLVIKDK